jgi:hypothetical protein
MSYTIANLKLSEAYYYLGCQQSVAQCSRYKALLHLDEGGSRRCSRRNQVASHSVRHAVESFYRQRSSRYGPHLSSDGINRHVLSV